jgi:hypothetical protein
LVDLQLDAQNSYLFTYNTFIKLLYMFRALPCSSSGGLRRNCIYAASGIVTLSKVVCLQLPALLLPYEQMYIQSLYHYNELMPEQHPNEHNPMCEFLQRKHLTSQPT